jgi:hypothetical protein
MGSYLHVGLVVRASVQASDLASNEISGEVLAQWMCENCVDPEMFDRSQRDDQIVWSLNESFTAAPLVAFLKEQDAISGVHASNEHKREELYEDLLKLNSWEAIVALAKEGKHRDFYCFDETELITGNRPRSPVRVPMTLLVFLSEGKTFMECWRDLFRYLEHMIHAQADRFPIARAVKLAVG